MAKIGKTVHIRRLGQKYISQEYIPNIPWNIFQKAWNRIFFWAKMTKYIPRNIFGIKIFAKIFQNIFQYSVRVPLTGTWPPWQGLFWFRQGQLNFDRDFFSKINLCFFHLIFKFWGYENFIWDFGIYLNIFRNIFHEQNIYSMEYWNIWNIFQKSGICRNIGQIFRGIFGIIFHPSLLKRRAFSLSLAKDNRAFL